MKKAILSAIGILVILVSFSFTNSNFDNERTIKITSDKMIEFDMVQNGIITKGMKTPHEFKFNGNQVNFIFKSKSDQTELKLNVENKNGNLSAEWGIIVLIIENDKMSTFGIN